MNNVVKMFGPPGTGKTYALLNLLDLHLAKGCPPERVAYLTFTTKARHEAVTRTVDRFGFDPKEQLPYFRTLHSIAYRELGVSAAMMARKMELREFSELIGMEMSANSSMTESGLTMTNGEQRGDKFMTFDHLRRHRGQTIEEAYRGWREDEDLYITRHFVQSYTQWKVDEGLLDFTDLLRLVEKPLPVDVVFVDEAQDLSSLQWKALEVLAADASRVYIAGDDDQAIFEWAGANPTELLNLKGETKILGQSYRIPRAVHEVAGTMVAGIKKRQPKEWKPRDEKGKVTWIMEPEFIDWERDGSYLVLYRNHYFGKPIEEILRSDGMPFGHARRTTVGGDWSLPIVMWEKLRKGEALEPAQIHSIYEAMVSGHSITRDARRRLEQTDREAVDMEVATAELGLQTDAPWYRALDKIPDDDVAFIRRVVKHHGAKALTDEPKVLMSTIHAAKGGEADHVVLLTNVSRKVANEIHLDPDSERRVFYVGLTRARVSLQIVGFHNPLFTLH